MDLDIRKMVVESAKEHGLTEEQAWEAISGYKIGKKTEEASPKIEKTSMEVKLDKIIEQNQAIIKLLEKKAKVKDATLASLLTLSPPRPVLAVLALKGFENPG